MTKSRLAAMAVLLAAFAVHPCRAADSDCSAIAAAIQAGNYDKAEVQVDRMLEAEPNNVNANMYKGNILYYRGSNAGGIQLYGNEDESIYESSIGYMGQGSSLVSPEVAKKIAFYFRRALKQAPGRMDIQLGLCWTYANAGMKDELIARFPIIKRLAGKKPGLQYNMGDYARIIADNYSFEDGMAVYRAIAGLYPRDGNIVNDMAAMYFKKGDLAHALLYFSQAAHMGRRDDKTLSNLVMIYAVVDQFDKSVQYQAQVSAITKDHVDILYRALYEHLQGNPDWQKGVHAYLAKAGKDDKSKPYVDLATDLLALGDKTDYQLFAATLQHKVDTTFDLLSLEWGLRAFPERWEPGFRLAELLTYYQNYERSNPLFARIESGQRITRAGDREKLNFYYAWSLHRAHRDTEANAHWKRLLKAKVFYRKSAAYWFLGNYHYERKEYKKAASFFVKMKDKASKSKYANYCANVYRGMKDKL
jgi:Flp pilus assembly protein TadD